MDLSMKNLFIYVLVILLANNALFAQVPKKAIKHYQEARLAYTFEKRVAAIDELNKAIKSYPKYVEAYALKAKIDTELERYSEAISGYERIFELSPKDECKVYFQIGKVYMLQEKYKNAIDYLDKSASTINCAKSTIANAEKQKLLSFFRDSLMNTPVSFEPLALDSLVNSDVHDYLPMLTADGEHLFFTRRLGSPPLYNEDFYEAHKDEDGNWMLAFDMGEPINTQFNEGALTISPDGKRLFYAAADKFGGEGNFDIWYSFKQKGKWVKPMNLGRPINSPLWESQPSISADGKELFFTAKNGKGEGGIDIWVSKLVNNIWQEPENLGNMINTDKDEQCPFIHPDGKTLYFSSNGHNGMGSSDLFVVRRDAKGEWGMPVNLGYPINTRENENSLFVSADGLMGYYSQFINGSFDLVSFELPENVRPAAVTYVKGTVASAADKIYIPSTIEIYDAESGELTAITKTKTEESEFLITLPIGRDYIFSVESKGFLPHSEHFSLIDAGMLKSYDLEIFMNPIPVKETVVLSEVKPVERKIVMKNIFFESNSAELMKTSFIELNKIVDILNENDQMKMRIEGHTDNIGSEAVNLSLSQKRADSVKNFLVESGILSSRLSTKGKGETEPIDTNETEEGRANNRRTEFVIQE